MERQSDEFKTKGKMKRIIGNSRFFEALIVFFVSEIRRIELLCSELRLFRVSAVPYLFHFISDVYIKLDSFADT